MSKVNLTLVKNSDIAVLQSGERCAIHSVLKTSFTGERYEFRVAFKNKMLMPTYYLEGTPKLASNNWAITDVLRNEKSIFNPENN